MIALIDYGAGNTASVANTLTDLNADYVITNRESDICKADKIIFPGVGEASFAIRKLNLYNLINALRIIKKPFLGICLGMQLMCDESEEGNVKCLGIFPAKRVSYLWEMILKYLTWAGIALNLLRKVNCSMVLNPVNIFTLLIPTMYLKMNLHRQNVLTVLILLLQWRRITITAFSFIRKNQDQPEYKY